MANSTQTGVFVPSTYIWDVAQVSSLKANPDLQELLVRMYQNINQITLALNVKDSGVYALSEFVNGQLLFPNPNNNSSTAAYPAQRQILRKVINFGALPNAGTKAVAHGIICTSATLFTRIYGAASDTTGFNYIPLSYASPTLVNNIELKVDGTNVTVITGIDRTNFNMCLIILEYVQS
jgi:hypothetical protein